MQVGSLLSKALQGVTKTEDEVNENQETSASGDFESYLKGILSPDAANNVSEEELFAGLVGERIKSLKGQELSDKYNQVLSVKKTEHRAADGYTLCEDAAKAALRDLREAGDLTTEEADKIYSEAFAGAQLDGNKDALYDGRGGAGDDTIAISQLEAALLSSRTLMEKFDAQNEEVTMRSLDEASNAKPYVAPVVHAPSTDYSSEDYSDTGSDDLGTSNTDSDANMGDDLSALELALQLNKKIINKNLDKGLMDTLYGKTEKDKAL